jgi:hypothetical protein
LKSGAGFWTNTLMTIILPFNFGSETETTTGRFGLQIEGGGSGSSCVFG